MYLIRPARADDCQQMLDIYQPFIQKTVISFEVELPSLGQFKSRVAKIQRQFPWLVCTHDHLVIGYAYAGPHRNRPAYQWSTELSVYVSNEFQRKGIASALYQSLMEILKLQGFYTALAGITLPNPASVKFHRSIGFSQLGIYKNIGYKLNDWHSVSWWEYPLKSYRRDPAAPIPIGMMSDKAALKGIFTNYTSGLNY